MAKFLPTLATGAIVALAIGLGVPVQAAPVTAVECVGQSDVWAQIQHDDALQGRRATTFTTATEATRSADFTLEGLNGLYKVIDELTPATGV